MAEKYHVNGITGDYGVCKAFKKECPLGDTAEHYTDLEEAMYQSEVILANKLGLFKTKAKVVQPTVNETYSFPQADRLDRLAETIDAINLGAKNSEDLSNSINTVSRQALYYADAAGYLGFVEHTTNKRKEYRLTPSGQSFVQADAKDRDTLLRSAINNIPAVKVYRESGEKAAAEYIAKKDESNAETIERKMKTVKSWSAKLDSISHVVNYKNDLSDLNSRDGNANKEKAQGELCMSCFMTKPLTGVCPNCDE